MAVTVSEPSVESRPFKMGDFDAQILNISAVSGSTTGTLTSTSLARLSHVLLPSGFEQTAAPVYANNVATLAFTVPAETASSQVKGGVTITAVANLGAAGNAITLTYTSGGTAGAEVVTVVGTAISVQIESGVSSITQVRVAINLSAAAAALVTATGTSGTAVVAATVTSNTGGVTGGAAGSVLCLGRP